MCDNEKYNDIIFGQIGFTSGALYTTEDSWTHTDCDTNPSDILDGRLTGVYGNDCTTIAQRLHNEDTFFRHSSPLVLRIADSGQLTPFCCCGEDVGEVKEEKTLNQVHNAEEQRFETKRIILPLMFRYNRSFFHFSLGKGGKNRRRGKNENESEKRELVFKEDGQGFYHFILLLS